jgi:hypothetical protein
MESTRISEEVYKIPLRIFPPYLSQVPLKDETASSFEIYIPVWAQ